MTQPPHNRAEASEGRVADADARNWVDRFAPEPWRPYLRLMRADRPIGTWLLLLPCWQGVALAILANGWRPHDLWLFIAFAIGAFVMRGAGCCLNDIADRNFDAQVARTRSRPIPSGQITVRQAVVFMFALCAVGLAVLLSLNGAAIIWGFAAVLPAAIYPFMKRFTYWPQFFLGIAFNWGALIGWVAHTGEIGWPALALYLGGIAWTLGYDTIYAHQDKEDDALIGVKSTALLLGGRTIRWLWGFYGAALVLAMVAAGLAVADPLWAQQVPRLALAIGLWAYGWHLYKQIQKVQLDDPDTCLAVFKSNREAGLLLVAALMLPSLLASV
jgi:4-hydroxybenzoate polyprenyltransferase